MTTATGTNAVTLVDVSLRDGLQDEDVIVPTGEKVRLAGELVRAGFSAIELTSFVHPRWVPQLADAEQVVALVPKGPRYSALVLNERGYQRAATAFTSAGFAAGAFDLVFVISASARHAFANNNRTISESFEIFERVAAAAERDRITLRAVISCAFGSPWNDELIRFEDVAEMAKRYAAAGVQTVTLADTVGLARTASTQKLVDAVLREVPADRLAFHLHDRLGVALENIACGIDAGIRIFEGALAGLGGCPFAPDAPGNVDLAMVDAWLRQRGFTTGIDAAHLASVAGAIRSAIARGDAPLTTQP